MTLNEIHRRENTCWSHYLFNRLVVRQIKFLSLLSPI